MEAGPSRSTMMGFGENSSGIFPRMMMMPLMNPNSETDNKAFLPPPWNNINSDQHSRRLPQRSGKHHINSSSVCFMESSSSQDSPSNCAMSAKIMTHPHFPRLLAAYVNCQKVGAPPEVVARLEEACASGENMARSGTGCIGEDPALDQFMEAYCEMLTKYEQELTKPLKEAMRFLSRIECQFKALSTASSDSGDITSLILIFSL